MSQPKDYGFGSDEQMIKNTARKFLAEHASVEKLRALVAKDPHAFAGGKNASPLAAYDESVWKKVVELGWPALPVPESAGGVGMKMVGVAGLVEEVGRAAFPSPLLSTYFAAFALREAGTGEAKKWLEKIAGGESASLAATNAEGSWEPSDTDVSAKESGTAAALSGTASFVQDARKASFFVVSAKAASGVGLYAIAANAPGVSLQADRIVDTTRDQARVAFKDAKAELIAPAPQGAEALRKALPSIWTVLAADLVGSAEWLLQTTVQYAKVREQFDHPIGFFQAVKHPLVNVMVENDYARSLLYNAACAIDTEPENAEKYARMAKAQASDAAAYAADRAVQLHGGIGFTWECDVHLFFKRSKHGQALFGDAAYHRRKLADLLIGPVAAR